MDKKRFDFKKFLKTYYRKIILYSANIIAFALIMAWAMKVYRLEGGDGYGVLGPIVYYTFIYLVFAFFSLIVYYLSIIAGAFTNMHKEKNDKAEKEELKSEKQG